ncbi:MAG: Crp/Fnr family transcriptional regulator [Clostridiales bacterium]|nr:Crp/Fnr family transcriptional regulator [Clostridiales bacterium]
MERYFDILQRTELFKGIGDADLAAMLHCLGAEIKPAPKNQVLLRAGDAPQSIGIVLAGQLHIVRDDYYGNRSIEAVLGPGELFAEALCYAKVMESPVTVIANSDAIILLLRGRRILHSCQSACAFHTTFIENMLRTIANKNLRLQSHMEILSLKSIRARVLRYLEPFRPKQHNGFTIPFNRAELADYLCVERSALSHELARMQREGLITYRKNRFNMIEKTRNI